MFKKAGSDMAWAAFVPIVNVYETLKVGGRPGWWLILYFIAIVNLVVAIIVWNDLSKSFGKGVGFTIGLILLPWVFLAILGWGSASYQGPAAASDGQKNNSSQQLVSGVAMTRNYFITGGAGFNGSNYVHRLVQRGESVIVYDNLSRAGAPKNVAWLEKEFGKDAFKLIGGDLRDADLLAESAREADVIVHLAGQVAVTTSVINPRDDFEANALGTFNALEAARLSKKNPIFIYSSTNKVYGGMEDVELVEEETRWRYKDLVHGASEAQPLDFHSP